jgi:hypothetical protein
MLESEGAPANWVIRDSHIDVTFPYFPIPSTILTTNSQRAGGQLYSGRNMETLRQRLEARKMGGDAEIS